jgi:hypothetical protein
MNYDTILYIRSPLDQDRIDIAVWGCLVGANNSIGSDENVIFNDDATADDGSRINKRAFGNFWPIASGIPSNHEHIHRLGGAMEGRSKDRNKRVNSVPVIGGDRSTREATPISAPAPR